MISAASLQQGCRCALFLFLFLLSAGDLELMYMYLDRVWDINDTITPPYPYM